MNLLTQQFIQKAINNKLQNQTCLQLHNGSCNIKFLQQFLIGCRSVSKIYLIVHLIPFLIFKRKKFIENPLKEFKHFLKGLILSILFGGMYPALVRRFYCFLINLTGYNQTNSIFAGILGGIALNFEPIHRQSQIALFCLNKSMETSYNLLIRRKINIKIPYGQILVFSIAITIISYHYFNNKEIIGQNYRKVIDILLINC